MDPSDILDQALALCELKKPDKAAPWVGEFFESSASREEGLLFAAVGEIVNWRLSLNVNRMKKGVCWRENGFKLLGRTAAREIRLLAAQGGLSRLCSACVKENQQRRFHYNRNFLPLRPATTEGKKVTNKVLVAPFAHGLRFPIGASVTFRSDMTRYHTGHTVFDYGKTDPNIWLEKYSNKTSNVYTI
ncbi:hypothetical protein M5K25_004869 [Dendrobium thyrsiflorum]|uniref:Uncharacterized protein n=1 Tax=Dendrobium thyrsiflorum TaxID=117978 RepID=A0ABD0VFZ7_DENTH